MSRNHISMRKIREILRLRFMCGYSHEKIAKSIGIASSTVGDCLKRAFKANLSWPLPEDINDEQLEINLYAPQKTVLNDDKQRGIIDWVYIHQELKRKSVTLMLLWKEHKNQYPKGLGYSQFCEHYRKWRNHLDVWMRQPHKAGEKLFVDYAGQTIPVIDSQTGEIREAQIFVATLGASNFTYAEATWTQTLSDWINSHIHAFEFFEGCPEIVVIDNLKSGVSKTHLYEPDINPTYQDMAIHYGVAIIPARSRSPKDKAKVENSVLQVERQILAKLRNRRFFGLCEVNQGLKPLLEDLNTRPFQKLPGSRLSQFQALDKPMLKPLPAVKYEYSDWKKVRVGFNYHVEIEGHHYSVPYVLAKTEIHARYTQKTIELFCKNKRIASHIRSYIKYGYTTDSSHMPKSHQKYVEWTPERLTSWAHTIGASTGKLIEGVMASRDHPQQGFRSCIGIIRLSKSYGEGRLEAACKRALYIGTYNYKSVESILKKNLDQSPLPTESAHGTISDKHENIRGKEYFN